MTQHHDRASVVATAVLQTTVQYFVEHWSGSFAGADLHALVAELLRDEFADCERRAAADRPCTD